MRSRYVLAAAMLLPLSGRSVEVDGVVATVDTQSILRSDIVREMRRMNADESHYEEIRNALIERQLILKAAATAKLSMQEWVVDNRIREIIEKSFEGDRNKLVAMLAQQKLPYAEWRQRIKDDMIVSAMRWNIIDKNVSASPSEMQAEYKSHPERYQAEGRVTVSVILLKPENAGRRAEVKAALGEKSFAELAKTYSADTHAAEGGVWKDVNPIEVFRPEVCAEIARIPKGAVSDWVEVDGWSFLLRKDDEIGAHARTFADAYDDIEENVKRENAQKLYTDWMERLKEESYIKIY
ncbi:MAG: peptidyl-prolyl cis-trans isomerase [Kiritimatiellia bacterium]